MLTPAELGLYGLFTVTVTFAMLGVGLDFYTYTQREILARPRPERSVILLHHAGISGLAYLVVMPAAMLAFVAGFLPWWMAPWFTLLLIVEHCAQEINRLLIAVQRQLAAGLVLCLRQGMWIWVALGLMWLLPQWRSLTLVFTCWLVGVLFALILGGWLLSREVERPGPWRWDWLWLRKGLRTGLTFLAASMLLRGILTFDRYLFEIFAGLELLGAYTLYGGLALALMNFMNAAVFVFRFPPMVQAYQHGHYADYRREWRHLVRDTCTAVPILVLPAAILAPIIAMLIQKPLYLENIAIFWWLLAAVTLQALGMIPHYGLYAMRQDRLILISHAAGLVAFLPAAVILANNWSVTGIPAAVAAAFGCVLIVNLSAYRWTRNRTPLADQSSPQGADE